MGVIMLQQAWWRERKSTYRAEWQACSQTWFQFKKLPVKYVRHITTPIRLNTKQFPVVRWTGMRVKLSLTAIETWHKTSRIQPIIQPINKRNIIVLNSLWELRIKALQDMLLKENNAFLFPILLGCFISSHYRSFSFVLHSLIIKSEKQ